MEEFARKNPWLGLESYKEGEILYGRDDDIRDLSQCVLNDTDTLLYGKSGIGKSSILNAGILPAARRSGYLPVLIRLSHKEKHSYLYQINQAIFNAILNSPTSELGTDVSITNGDHVLNETQTLIREVVSCKDAEAESFYEYFHRHIFYNSNGDRLKLLIIFDQFEEIFTLQDDVKKKKNFFIHLADLLNDVMPDELQQKVEISSDTQEEIIVDEGSDFNNIFDDLNLGVENSLPEYVADNDIHFVFTIREDFLSEFEYYSAAIPSLKQNRYGLRPINEEQAAQIILRPEPGLIDESVAKLIIEKITGKREFKLDGVPEIEVDSAVLSLYLNRLYEAKEGDTITRELVEQKGGEIISDFYNEAMSDISDSTVEYLEENLINGQGHRDNITVYDAQNDGKVSEYELEILCDKRKILRQFYYAGNIRIEYVHDILCGIVNERLEHREQKLREKEEQKRQAEEREKLEKEKRIIMYKKTRNRKHAFILSFVAAVLVLFSIVIVSMFLKNKEQRHELETLDNEIRTILPAVIEQQIKDGDSYKAGRLLLKLFPDTLYAPGDPTRVSLLRRLSGSQSTILSGHTRAVNIAMFSNDGNWAVTGSDDMSVKIWESRTGRLVSSVLVGSPVASLAISHDDKRFVVATKDGSLKIYSINRGNALLQDSLSIGNSYARFVIFNPDGAKVFACCTDGNLLVCNSLNLSKNKAYKLGKRGATYIAFDKGGHRMALAGTDNSIVICDAVRFTSIKTLLGHEDWVRSVDFSSDGESLVSCSDDKTVRLWDLRTKTFTIVEELSDWGTKSIFSPDGKRIISSSRDGFIRIVDISTLCEIPELQINQQNGLKQFSISSDGRRIITCSTNAVAHIWDCGNPMETGVSMKLHGAVYGVSFLNGEKSIAAVSNKGELGVWDVESGVNIWKKEKIGRATSLKVSPDGKVIALSVGSKIQLFNSCNGDMIDFDNTGGHHGWIRSLCFNHKGDLLVSVGDDRTIVLWDFDKRKFKSKILGHTSEVYTVDISKDDKKIVTGSVDMTIRQWDIMKEKQIGTPITGHKHVVLSVRYNSNDSLILSSSGDQTACIWKTDGTLVEQFVGGSGYMTDAIFGLTEDEIITASADKYVRIWCLSNGKENARFGGHFGGISRLALSKDGILVSSDQLGEINVWKIPDLKSVADELSKKYIMYK